MILIKDQLQKAGKTTAEYLSWLEDGRYNHNLEGHEGKNLIVTERNGGSANEIYIDEILEDNFNQFLNA